LPILIQLPILFALYSVINRPLTFMLGLSEETIMRIANIVNVGTTAELLRSREIVIAQAMSSQIAKVNADMGLSLTPINFNFLGIDLAQVPSFSHFSALWIIPIGAAAAAYFSQKWMMKLNPAMAGNEQAASMRKP
jgi:YidC/Oxa1 family membrane protein insertase